MSSCDRLLEWIEEGLVAHGGDLGGWTKIDADTLQIFDGRVTLRAKLEDPDPSSRQGVVHAHVFATLHEFDDEVLDACLFGVGKDDETALAQAAAIWITGVGGPIRSLIENKPVCMTCRAGVAGGDPAKGHSPGDYGLQGVRAFVGPSIARGIDDTLQQTLNDTKPWFRFAVEAAAPRRVHLAKVCILSKGTAGWSRELEIDGHEVSFHESDWPAGANGPEFGYLSRFAVFEFPTDSAEIARRRELEKTIRYFAENFSRHESIDSLVQAMAHEGFAPELIQETHCISTIAFSRAFFEGYGVQYSSTIIRARGDGRIETDVPLMSIPAFTRARALAAQLRHTMPPDDFRSLCFYNAESNAILQAVEAAGDKVDFSQMKMYPCVVPDRDASAETVNEALAMLKAMTEPKRSHKQKPWWKFW